MAGLCEGGNEPPGSLKASSKGCRENNDHRGFFVGERGVVDGYREDGDDWGMRAWDVCLKRPQAKPSTRSSYLLAWSPNSPDLTPPDFFVWGFVKDIVYSQKPRNIDDLRVKITQAFQQITPLTLQRTWAELHHRYELTKMFLATTVRARLVYGVVLVNNDLEDDYNVEDDDHDTHTRYEVETVMNGAIKACGRPPVSQQLHASGCDISTTRGTGQIGFVVTYLSCMWGRQYDPHLPIAKSRISIVSREGPRPTTRLLASRPHAEAEVDDHPTRMEVSCGYHDDPPAVIAGIRKRISLPIADLDPTHCAFKLVFSCHFKFCE
ncbi:hypothetical protein ANN_20360 [Periplaneta americana]|uniref:Uncharacterized protein n=1 Tax=Periplaneta americana TaxID=6978 RepID=A0ABQ8SCM4_PERAM|nr:hypothetical protein ANN_20360 [Periplaneta americana]